MKRYKQDTDYDHEVRRPYWGTCDVKGCTEISCSGGMYWRKGGYWSICSKHADECRKGKPQPEMKATAIKREKSRLPDGCLPSINPKPHNP